MSARGKPRIVLSMIVRNERTIIERCLRSALAVVDAAVVCDTGSTDDTPAIALSCLSRATLPFALHDHTWQDFGANRTAALDAARQFLSGLGWRPADTYWLFLDADQELVVEPGFDAETLTQPALSLRQRNGSLVYWNLRLARADLHWRAVGVTHEHYACNEPVHVERCTGLWVRDHGDGGFKSTKFEQDLDLLTTSLERNPDDPRTVFYLAQTCEALGDRIRALLLYRKRIALGGWPEEVYYSMLSIGRIFAASGDLETASAALLEAQRMDPERAEPLFELARLHRLHGDRVDAAAFAARGRRIPFPGSRSLFVDAGVYEYGLDLELAQSAAGTALREAGFAACERVVLSRTAPPAVVHQARHAALAYVETLKGARFLRLQPAIAPPYHPCNPGILQTPDGYLVNCRAVNYMQNPRGYASDNADQMIRSRNVMMRLAKDFSVLDERPVVIDEPPLRYTAIQGLEDCRLFELQGSVCFLCVTADRHPSGHIHMSVCRLDDDGHVVSHRPLVGVFDDRPQKNWLPFADPDGSVRAIYGYDPFTVVRISVDSGEYEVEAEVAHSLNAAGWRGSAGPVSMPGTGRWLMLVHEVVVRHRPGRPADRVYLQRFVEVECDPRFVVTRISRPFVFAHHGIEFPCGMTLSHDGRELVIGLGIEDSSAYLCRLPLARVERLLQGLDDLSMGSPGLDDGVITEKTSIGRSDSTPAGRRRGGSARRHRRRETPRSR